MPKPISRYDLSRTEISSRSVTILGQNYGSAIIYFTPKIGEKNVDIKSLSCEFVQIIDRGEWGKEEVRFSVEASSSTNRKYRQFYFENDGDSYELKFLPTQGLKLALIEVYFDPDSINNMPTNNPSQVDPSALAAAFSTALANNAQIQADATANAINQSGKGRRTTSSLVQALPWSGNFTNHKIVLANINRLQSRLFHTGKNGTAISNSRVSAIIGSTTNKTNLTPDTYLITDGEFVSNQDEDTLEIYAWVDANKSPVTLSLSEYFPLETATL